MQNTIKKIDIRLQILIGLLLAIAIVYIVENNVKQNSQKNEVREVTIINI